MPRDIPHLTPLSVGLRHRSPLTHLTARIRLHHILAARSLSLHNLFPFYELSINGPRNSLIVVVYALKTSTLMARWGSHWFSTFAYGVKSGTAYRKNAVPALISHHRKR